MFGIGGQEIIIIGLIFLVVFGPSKLPQILRRRRRRGLTPEAQAVAPPQTQKR
ncbi:MAG: twin-arginine translocase TatA/TatE family subunit [Actinobacteria bacterium]|nr:twin-arginine translocase TatA/TatE family subunit [Actinomycetota bacterium]